MTLRDEKSEHPPNRCKCARHAARRNPGNALRLKIANDVNALDAIELEVLIAKPHAEFAQVRFVSRERVPGETFLDREVVAKNRHVRRLVRRFTQRLLRCHSERSEEPGRRAARCPRHPLPDLRYARDDTEVATVSAIYELRTNGPAKTARNPNASPIDAYSSKTDGWTYSTTSSFSRFGCRYCPIVKISHPESSRRCITSMTSSRRSPRPSIRPDFVTMVGSRRFTMRNTDADRSKRAPGRTKSYRRGTVS